METVGRFELRRVLARGRAASVYEARDLARGGRVALKLVAEKLSPSPALRARYLREAQLASDLAHPNLVHVVETGEHRGRPFVAMELVEGVDLERVIRSGRPFPVEWTIDVLRQVCEGLHRAHVSGLVHADLKPADIRVNPEGVVKLVDFGVTALKLDERVEEGQRLSGIHYRAPEVIEGKRPDPKSDMFSVGAIFYELLASQKPFPADTITGVMFRIRHDNVDPKGLPATEFSPGLEDLVLRALRRDPKERYPDLEVLREELARLVQEAAPRLQKRAPGDEAAPAPAEAAAGEAGAPPEGAALHTALARARTNGESQLALAIVRRLLDIDPDDLEARRVAEEIEALGREAEAEQLCAIALAYAADGEVDKAAEIAEKIERLSPWSPRYLQLQVYLDEEAARHGSEGPARAAQDRLLAGDFAAALKSAEAALLVFPLHRLALEVKEKALLALPNRGPDDVLVDELEAALAEEASREPSPSAKTPGSRPSPPEPASPREPEPSTAPARVSQGEGAPSPLAAPGQRRTDVELLTSAALDRFLQDDHPGARRAASMALELDPQNRKARELLKILGVLG